MPSFTPASGLLATLDLLQVSHAGAVTHVRLNRPAKRNALSDPLIQQLHTCFVNLPEARACGSAQRRGRTLLRRPRPVGTDGARCRRRRAALAHVARGVRRRCSSAACRWWRCCTAPWSAAGSSWRLPATSASPTPALLRPARGPARHLRRRRRLGAHPAADGRGAHDRPDDDRPRLRRGRRACAVGLSQYVVPAGEGLAKGWSWRERIAANAPMSNYRGDARVAAHRRPVAERRPVHRIADGRGGREHARGQEPVARLPRRARRQGRQVVRVVSAARRSESARSPTGAATGRGAHALRSAAR